MRREVGRLRALGYPVNATQGVGGGSGWARAWRCRVLLGDEEEMAAVVCSPRGRWRVAGASEAAVRTLAKLDQVLPARLRAEVRALHDAITTLDGGRWRWTPTPFWCWRARPATTTVSS